MTTRVHLHLVPTKPILAHFARNLSDDEFIAWGAALDRKYGFPFGHPERDYWAKIVKQYSGVNTDD